MYEAGWLSSERPAAMLRYLRGREARPSRKRTVRLHTLGATDRKLRLFACACLRCLWPLLHEPLSRWIVEVAERYAESAVLTADFQEALRYETRLPPTYLDSLAWGCVGWQGLTAAEHWCSLIEQRRLTAATLCQVRLIGQQVPPQWQRSSRRTPEKELLITPKKGAALVREVLGNPFQPWPPRDVLPRSLTTEGPLLDRHGRYTIERCREHKAFDGSYNPAGVASHAVGVPFWDGSRHTCDACWGIYLTMPTSLERKDLEERVRRTLRLDAQPAMAQAALPGTTVHALSHAAYTERLPDGLLDPERLAILADALEEEGCTDRLLLDHLHSRMPCLKCGGTGTLSQEQPWGNTWAMETVSCACNDGWMPLPTPHVRGCWALDAVRG